MLDRLPPPQFLFVIAQPEAKPWLLAELRREHPELRLAYSRPGLYTFKSAAGSLAPDCRIRSVFSRHQGCSLGNVTGASGVVELLAPMPESLVRLHVFGRDAGENVPTLSPEAVSACRAELLGLAPTRFHLEPTPKAGEWVLDVVLPTNLEQGEPWLVGYHRHERNRSAHPGGVTRQIPPPYAPSRAFSKLEEVLLWFGIPMQKGETAMEIGCAPGGAVISLLDRGLQVIGVDPAQLSPQVLDHASEISGKVQHILAPIEALRREQLPDRIDWLLCDANLAPQLAIRHVAHWVKVLRPHLRGLIFTMKMNDQKAVDAIPKLVDRVAEFGLGQPRAVQLPSHRREIVVTAFRTRGNRGHQSGRRG